MGHTFKKKRKGEERSNNKHIPKDMRIRRGRWLRRGGSGEREGDKREGWEVEETGILPVTVHNCPTIRKS